MSDYASIVAQEREMQTQNYIGFSFATMLIFDYILTFGSEVSLFWTRKFPVATPFLLIRLLMLLSAFFTFVTSGNVEITSSAGCVTSLVFSMLIQMGVFIMMAIVSAMRVHAVGGRQWPLTITVFSIALLPAVVNLYAAARSTFYLDDGYCSYNQATTSQQRFICTVPLVLKNHLVANAYPVTILSRVGTVLSDIIVVATIWYKTYGIARLYVQTWTLRKSLVWYLLRDGTIYFLILLVLNIVDIMLFYFAGVVDFIHSILLPLSLVLMSRLLINIREVAYTRQVVMGSTTSPYSSTGLDTPVEMSSVAFEPTPQEFQAGERRRKDVSRMMDHEYIVGGSITADETGFSIGGIEMVERNGQSPI